MLVVIIASAIIIAILLAIIVVVHKVSEPDEWDTCFACIFLGLLLGLCCVICFNATSEYISPTIKPLDVYQGKTTLEYIVRDGEVIDSVIVWKEKIQ